MNMAARKTVAIRCPVCNKFMEKIDKTGRYACIQSDHGLFISRDLYHKKYM